MISYRWGGVGRGNNVNEALRIMNTRSTITNLVAVAPFYIYLTWGYRHGIYKQDINRRVILYIYIYINNKSAKRLTWKHSTAEIQGRECIIIVIIIISSSSSIRVHNWIVFRVHNRVGFRVHNRGTIHSDSQLLDSYGLHYILDITLQTINLLTVEHPLLGPSE